MQTYTSYKPSNIEWIGEIPSHWRILRMKFLCQITTGNKDTKDRKDEGEYPFYVRSQTVERIDSYSFEGEGILTAGDGVGVGKVYHHVNGKFAFHQRVYLLYNFNNVLGKYLFEYFKNNFSITVEDQNAKSTVDSLRLNMLQDFPVAIPSISEQQAIVNYLDHKTALIDELITKKERKIELLKEQRSALINHVVTKGLNPNAPMKDSGIDWIGEIPEHWEVKLLKYVADKIDEAPISNELLFAVENIESYTGKLIGLDKVIEYEGSIAGFRKGDTIFNKLRPYLSKVYFAECEGGYFGELLTIRGKKGVYPKFLYHILSSKGFLEIVNSSSEGTKMPRANWETSIKLISVPKPQFQEQKEIVIFLDNQTTIIDKSIEIETQKIEKLKEYRQSLISNVVTGKIKVF
ncbi:restriction endonuclease subunit S [Emticicia fluvialis]|uniref:restriction endonuclease subunit S n=1 Tax=Emticicia fluvialis TaxID=2974474 RepID=UPI0021651F5E|nr:restriction endonuclease subunit S [Emticicia fluvialis]